MNWRAILKNPTNQENKENQEYQDRLKSNIPDILGSEELKNEIFEQAKYLFFERLGISEDEELSFKEALNYINNQLTIN